MLDAYRNRINAASGPGDSTTPNSGLALFLASTLVNVSIMKVAPPLLSQLNGARYLVADKGYDANSLRRAFRRQDALPLIPGCINRKRRIAYDSRL